MKTVLCILGFSFFLLSCGSEGDKGQADQFRATMLAIGNGSHESSQAFIDAATKTVLELKSDPNCNIEFDTLSGKLSTAKDSIAKALSFINMLDEFDEEVNYRNSREAYLGAESEVFNEFETWLALLQKTREPVEIDEATNAVFEKLKLMKQKELIFKESQKKFISKYQLD